MNALAAPLALLIAALAAPAFGQHAFDCAKRAGVEKARCERHESMFAKCGPLKGDEHHACDRDYLLANPLKCDRQSGEEAAKCEKEVAAFKTCRPQPGREFMRCVRQSTGESPMGH
ncbi:MAG: hypothetical protein IPL06_10990 [Betaproteobacteria bacterium]|nr:hypothetical protein [Betaproteobacteria bacterium]